MKRVSQMLGSVIRKGGLMIASMSLIVIMMFFMDSLYLNAQSQLNQRPSTHFIILIDTTMPQFRSRLRNDTDHISTWLMGLVNSAVNHSAMVMEGRYCPQEDLISLIFFHYPLVNHRIESGPYLLTDRHLLLIKDINQSHPSIEQLIRDNRERFLQPPYSPIELTREIVFPFICSKIQKLNISLPNVLIRHIRLISIDDGVGRSIDHLLFSNSADWNRLEAWESFMALNFVRRPINNDNYYRFEDHTGHIYCENTFRNGRVYFHYFEIYPILNQVRLEAKDSIKMERFVLRGSGNRPNFVLRGNGVIDFFTGGYPGYLEWQDAEESESDVSWQRLYANGTHASGICMINQSIHEGENKISLQLDVPENIDKTLVKKYRFRGIIYYRNINMTNFQYPFQYQYYIGPISTRFRLKDDFLSIDNQTLISRMSDKKYLRKVMAYWVHNDHIKKQYPDSVKEGNVVVLSSGFVSRVDRWIQEEKKVQRMRKILFGICAIVGLTLLALFIPFFGRAPKIDVLMKKDTERIKVDFSESSRKPFPIMTLDVINLRRISKIRLKKEFSLNIHFKLNNTAVSWDQIKIKEGSGFSIKSVGDKREFPLQRCDSLEEENKLKGILENIKIGDQFKLIFHWDQVEDLLDVAPEEIDADITIKIDKIVGRYSESEKKVNVKVNENGNPLDARAEKIIFTFIPQGENSAKTITHGPGNSATIPKEQTKHILPYSKRDSIRQVFTVTITNKNVISYAKYTQGFLTLKVMENGNRINNNPVFYLGKEKDSLDENNKGIPIDLKAGETEILDCFVNFADIGENPLESRNFQVQCKFNNFDFFGSAPYVEIKRSEERTEALIAVEVEGKPAIFDTDDQLTTDASGSLLLNEETDKFEVTASVIAQNTLPIAIKDYTFTDLCTIIFTNGCHTNTGYYTWRIRNMELLNNNGIQFDEDGDPSRFFTVFPLNHIEGNVLDLENAKDGFTLRIDPDQVRQIIFQRYNLPIRFIIDLDIVIYPGENENGEEVEKSIYLKLDIRINGFHDVLPNHLIVDFGSSAISAAHYDYSLGVGEQGVLDKMNMLRLESLEGLLRGENGFLPSILNIVDRQTIGTEGFLNLPAADGIITQNPGYMITSLKLKILEGNEFYFLPSGFHYRNSNGRMKIGGRILLKHLLLSAYKNLKHNYLNENEFDAKKYIFTCPNIYTKSHQEFLLEVLEDVFVFPGNGIYKENIQLISESDAVLYYYIKKTAGKEFKEKSENLVIFDIGGSTMDITFAEIQREINRNPSRVENVRIKNRDGNVMAGETLDKAIAYQVHDILKEYNQAVQNDLDIGFEANETSFETECNTGDSNDLLTDARESDASLDLPIGESNPIEVIPGDPTGMENTNHYINWIVKGQAKAANIKYLMFEFKNKYILQFKKDISQATDDAWVEICLGENSSERGLIWNISGREIRQYVAGGISVNTRIESRNGWCYLGMVRGDWLKLSYMRSFEILFEKRIKQYREVVGREALRNATVILSGRTSLWPSIPETIKNVFGAEPTDIWPSDDTDKATALKRAVIEGAIYKVIYLNHIPFEKVGINGSPAVAYENENNTWEVKSLLPQQPVEVPLFNSPSFQIGMQTALNFLPFRGCEYISRDNLIDKDTTIIIHTQECDNHTGYEFMVQSDKYPEPISLGLDLTTSNHPRSSRINWPIVDHQLPEITPEGFSENI